MQAGRGAVPPAAFSCTRSEGDASRDGWYARFGMDARLLALPLLITVPAVLIFVATIGLNTVAKRTAHWHAVRPRFTAAEKTRLRTLRARYRGDERRHTDWSADDHRRDRQGEERL